MLGLSDATCESLATPGCTTGTDACLNISSERFLETNCCFNNCLSCVS